MPDHLDVYEARLLAVYIDAKADAAVRYEQLRELARAGKDYTEKHEEYQRFAVGQNVAAELCRTPVVELTENQKAEIDRWYAYINSAHGMRGRAVEVSQDEQFNLPGIQPITLPEDPAEALAKLRREYPYCQPTAPCGEDTNQAPALSFGADGLPVQQPSGHAHMSLPMSQIADSCCEKLHDFIVYGVERPGVILEQVIRRFRADICRDTRPESIRAAAKTSINDTLDFKAGFAASTKRSLQALCIDDHTTADALPHIFAYVMSNLIVSLKELEDLMQDFHQDIYTAVVERDSERIARALLAVEDRLEHLQSNPPRGLKDDLELLKAGAARFLASRINANQGATKETDVMDKPSESALELQTAKLLAGLLHATLEEQRWKAALDKGPDENGALKDAWYHAKTNLELARGWATMLQYHSPGEQGFKGYFQEQIEKQYADAQRAYFTVGRTNRSDEKKAASEVAELAEQRYPYEVCGGSTTAGITENAGGDLVMVHPEEYKEPDQDGPLTETKRMNRLCQDKLKSIGRIAAQLKATVQQNLKYYCTHTVPALAEQYHEEVSKILTWGTVKDAIARMEVDIADIRNAQHYAHNQFEFGWPDYNEDDLEHIKKTEKDLLELADRIHGIEKLPDEVAALTEADSGYHIGS